MLPCNKLQATWPAALLTISMAIAVSLVVESAMADEKNSVDEAAGNDPSSDAEMNARFNLPIKTGGGAQLWTDHAYRAGYRIQQNVWTGHWRLIDDADIRRAWGTRQECQTVLDRLSPPVSDDSSARETPRHVVVLLHGLMRTHHCMKPLERSLLDADIDDVIRFSYASSRSSIGDNALALREVLSALPADTTFSFVGHSMGNIVVRHLIGDLTAAEDPDGLLPRFRSMVMLGPPNQGSAIARLLAPTGLYGWITGKGGMELGVDWADLSEKLATPPFPFMIIAGDVSQNRIQNPLLPGGSDFVVTVDEAKLDGAQSFHNVAILHSFLMNDADAMKKTVEFVTSH